MGLGVGGLAGCSAPRQEDRSVEDTLHPDQDTGVEAGLTWPEFRLDQHNTGYAKGVSDLGDEPVVKWVFETDGDVRGSPVISDGYQLYVITKDGHLYVLRLEP